MGNLVATLGPTAHKKKNKWMVILQKAQRSIFQHQQTGFKEKTVYSINQKSVRTVYKVNRQINAWLKIKRKLQNETKQLQFSYC